MTNPHAFPEGIGYAAMNRPLVEQAGLATQLAYTLNRRKDGHTYAAAPYAWAEGGGNIPTAWGVQRNGAGFIVIDWVNLDIR